MSKYNPLRDYLRQQTSPRLELSFVEIEAILGRRLPPSAYARQWWISGRNSQQTTVWQRAWQSAGYDASLVLGADRVQFRRLS